MSDQRLIGILRSEAQIAYGTDVAASVLLDAADRIEADGLRIAKLEDAITRASTALGNIEDWRSAGQQAYDILNEALDG